MTPTVSTTRPVRILTFGFGLVIMALVLMAWLGMRQTDSIRNKAAVMVREHLFTAHLIDDLEREEQRAGALLLGAIRGASNEDKRRRVLADLSAFESSLPPLIKEGEPALPSSVWGQLSEAGAAYSSDIRYTLEHRALDEASIAALDHRYQDFIHLSGQIVKEDSVRSAELDGRIERESSDLANSSGWMIGGCLILALMCAMLTIQFTFDSLRRIEWQAQELTRVSWHLIQGQEAAARRFSHELHDELGQSLTALKATLLAMKPAELPAHRPDCLQLIDDAIGNVRELSQLLRPVILDDFGLGAALRWLTERFQERTRIQVQYRCSFEGRLAEEVETHLFRITQEALTNVARHACATHVKIEMEDANDKIFLSITDNGVGMPREREQSLTPGQNIRGLGLIGMRARAQQIDGTFQLRNKPSGGVRVDVSAPARPPADPEDEHIG